VRAPGIQTTRVFSPCIIHGGTRGGGSAGEGEEERETRGFRQLPSRRDFREIYLEMNLNARNGMSLPWHGRFSSDRTARGHLAETDSSGGNVGMLRRARIFWHDGPLADVRALSENTERDIWRDYARWRFEVEQAAILRSVNYANFDCREINGRRRRPRPETLRVPFPPHLPPSFPSERRSVGRWKRDVPSALDRPCIMQSTCNYCRSTPDTARRRSSSSSTGLNLSPPIVIERYASDTF